MRRVVSYDTKGEGTPLAPLNVCNGSGAALRQVSGARKNLHLSNLIRYVGSYVTSAIGQQHPLRILEKTHQMKITVKKVAFFLVACVVAGWVGSVWMQNDPYHAEVLLFVRGDQQVINQVGPISSAKLVGITSVQSSITHDNQFTPGYDLYRVNVRGERASVRVTVERKALQNGSSDLRVESIE